jgi:hypothetical protein
MGIEMTDRTSDRAPAVVAGCPWCGDGTPLTLKGDGFGGVALCCLQCNCRGPSTVIEGDFAEADSKAIQSWSTRSGIESEVLKRVRAAAQLATLLNDGKTAASTEVPVRYSDLVKIIRISKPDWHSSH